MILEVQSFESGAWVRRSLNAGRIGQVTPCQDSHVPDGEGRGEVCWLYVDVGDQTAADPDGSGVRELTRYTVRGSYELVRDAWCRAWDGGPVVVAHVPDPADLDDEPDPRAGLWKARPIPTDRIRPEGHTSLF